MIKQVFNKTKQLAYSNVETGLNQSCFFENISKYNQFFMCDKIIMAIIFGSFILNLYWFGLICSGVAKMVLGDTKVEDSILTQIATIRIKMGYASLV